MDGLFFLIKVKNWDKYNGRNDVKTNVWFRFDANFFQDARVYSMDQTEKLMLIWLFAAQCRSGNKPFLVFNRQLASDLGIEASAVDELVAKMSALDLIAVEKGLPKHDTGTNSVGIEPVQHVNSKSPNVTQTVPSVSRTDPDGSVRVLLGSERYVDLHGHAPKLSDPTNKQTNKTRQTDRQREEPAAAQPESESPSLRRSKFVFDLWNESCGALPKAMLFTEERQHKAADLLQHNANPIYWRDIIRRIADLPFANGENERGWVADFDWFLKPDTHVKVMEGKYDARSRKQPPANTEPVEEFGGWPDAQSKAFFDSMSAEPIVVPDYRSNAGRKRTDAPDSKDGADKQTA